MRVTLNRNRILSGNFQHSFLDEFVHLKSSSISHRIFINITRTSTRWFANNKCPNKKNKIEQFRITNSKKFQIEKRNLTQRILRNSPSTLPQPSNILWPIRWCLPLFSCLAIIYVTITFGSLPLLVTFHMVCLSSFLYWFSISFSL